MRLEHSDDADQTKTISRRWTWLLTELGLPSGNAHTTPTTATDDHHSIRSSLQPRNEGEGRLRQFRHTGAETLPRHHNPFPLPFPLTFLPSVVLFTLLEIHSITLLEIHSVTFTIVSPSLPLPLYLSRIMTMLFLPILALLTLVQCATKDDWRSRSIYQYVSHLVPSVFVSRFPC